MAGRTGRWDRADGLPDYLGLNKPTTSPLASSLGNREAVNADLASAISKLQSAGTGAKPTLTQMDVINLVGHMGSHPRGSVARVMDQILSRNPHGALLTVEFADGTRHTYSLAQYLQEVALEYFGPTAYRFAGDDPGGKGYDSDSGPSAGADADEIEAYSVADVSTVGKWPAPITEVPTSSSEPERPRTVAAGYDSRRKVLTVVFRDGSLYNYYGVSGLEWGRFLNQKSKGEVIAKFLDAKVRGYADTSGMPFSARQSVYKIARTAQVLSSGERYGKKRYK